MSLILSDDDTICEKIFKGREIIKHNINIMTDDEFINYFDSHSRTELALFSVVHINRLYRLAGEKPPYMPGKFYSFTYGEYLKSILAKAREPGRNLRSLLK